MHDLKILIAGAGVAGLTCVALLNKQGVRPVIVERKPENSFNHSGYMLGLLPLGGRVLNALDAREVYFENSIRMEQYSIHQGNGKLVKSYPLDSINRYYGSYRGISRIALIDILLQQVDRSAIRFGSEIGSLSRRNGAVEVTFSDGREEVFDLVIVAEGMHSATRKKILSRDEWAFYDTGWGGWVTWLSETPVPEYREYWNAGSFLGIYPVKDKIGVFLGGTVNEVKNSGLKMFLEKVKQKLNPGADLALRALNAYGQDDDPFFWEFHDCRSTTWQKDNIILLGDAGTGFLPTAGVGASAAMDSAAALADELSRADRNHIDYGLGSYSRRQKKKVENAQSYSRSLGKIMFLRSKLITALRNKMLRFYSSQRMLSDLAKIIKGK